MLRRGSRMMGSGGFANSKRAVYTAAAARDRAAGDGVGEFDGDIRESMGIYDRDNGIRPQRGGMGHLRMRSVTTWLIILNVAVYVVDLVLKARFLAGQHLPLRLATDPRFLADFGLVRYCYFSI